MVNLDIEKLKQEGFTYEEIQDIIDSEKNSEDSYDLDNAFDIVKKNLFSNKEEKCIK